MGRRSHEGAESGPTRPGTGGLGQEGAEASGRGALAELRAIFAGRCVSDDRKLLDAHSLDQVGDERYRQRPAAVVFPESTDEIAALMKWAMRTGTPVTPRGAGSGLAGAAITVAGGVVCSFQRMNRILEIDTQNLMVVVEPGVVTNALDDALKPHARFFAGYPMSEDICFIGGNVAENAGGWRAVKYGVTADYVLGAEVVTAAGDVLQLGGKRLKDVTGYNLLQLFVGSEGTLGLFTKLIIRVVPRPAQRAVLLSSFAEARNAAACVSALKREIANPPSAIEFIDGRTARDTTAAMPVAQRTQLPKDAAAILLVELDGDAKRDLTGDLEQVAKVCSAAGGRSLESGTNQAAMDRAWKLRKQIPWWAKRNAGPWQTHEDVVVPPARVVDLVTVVDELRSHYGLTIPFFGHAGDGNFHLVPLQPASMRLEEWAELIPRLLDDLYDRVAALGGTISGEHGIGRKRARYLSQCVGQAQLEVLRSIKRALDPNGILNPGVVLE